MVILFTMVFLHIFADYNLQGCLSNMKQKDWWTSKGLDGMYKYDYIVCLLTHAFMWAFVVFMPLLFLMQKPVSHTEFCIVFLLNILAHAYIDHLKANKKCINLITDQAAHLLQIFITYMLLYL